MYCNLKVYLEGKFRRNRGTVQQDFFQTEVLFGIYKKMNGTILAGALYHLITVSKRLGMDFCITMLILLTHIRRSSPFY